MKKLWVLCTALLLIGVPLSAPAEDLAGRWGVGAFADYYSPLLTFRDMYSGGIKLGGSVHYFISNRNMAEVEYHYARFKDGSLEDKTFFFGDGNQHKSPKADVNMKFNSLSANWLLAFHADGFGRKATPYATFGVGFYNYKHEVSGLIAPTQSADSGSPPDPTILMEPITDTRTALSFNAGTGVQFAIGEKASLDLRLRYNLVLGELRPFLAWDIEKTFPFHLLDIGVGFKVSM